MSILVVRRSETSKLYRSVNLYAINNKDITWDAKGILYYALTRPEGWKLRTADLIERSPDGEHVVRRVLKELRRLKYMHLFRGYMQGQKGVAECVYVVCEEPTTLTKIDIEEIQKEYGIDRLLLENIDGENNRLYNREAYKKKREEEEEREEREEKIKLHSLAPEREGVRLSEVEQRRLRKRAETARIFQPLVEKLRTILSARFKINYTSKMSKWTEILRKMHDVDDLSLERITTAIDNLARPEIVGHQYCPVIESATALRRKFTNFEAHVARVSPSRRLPPPLRPQGSPERRRVLS